MSDFRCSAASRDRGDSLAGTASTVRSFLLLEHPGPWGADALLDARLPEGLGAEITRRATASGVRPLLVRDGVRRRAGGPVRVFGAWTGPNGAFLESTELGDVREVLDLDLTALAAGRSLGLPTDHSPFLAVCTQGRHDACCAERGQPVVRALRSVSDGVVWEVSHIGGDRFAANALALPHGHYYGGLDAENAPSLLSAQAAGQVQLDLLRGRSCYPMPVQAAEIAVRRRTGVLGVDDVRRVEQRLSRDRASARFAVRGAGGEQLWTAEVVTSWSESGHRLTCQALRDNRTPHHEVVSLEQV